MSKLFELANEGRAEQQKQSRTQQGEEGECARRREGGGKAALQQAAERERCSHEEVGPEKLCGEGDPDAAKQEEKRECGGEGKKAEEGFSGEGDGRLGRVSLPFWNRMRENGGYRGRKEAWGGGGTQTGAGCGLRKFRASADARVPFPQGKGTKGCRGPARIPCGAPAPGPPTDKRLVSVEPRGGAPNGFPSVPH